MYREYWSCLSSHLHALEYFKTQFLWRTKPYITVQSGGPLPLKWPTELVWFSRASTYVISPN